MSTGGVIYPRRRKRTPRGIIPYDARLVKPSRELRKRQTEAEAILWALLRRKNVSSYKFTRQKPIDKFIVDFYCSKLLLGVEVDGPIHKQREQYDERRTQIINYYDIKMIRFRNEEIFDDLPAVARVLSKEIRLRENEIAAKNPAQR
jgi:very-short-patch-repair endonuclease